MRSFVRSRLGLFLVLLLVFAAGLSLSTFLCGTVQAASSPHIWLSQKVAPPTASLQVNGGGFGPSETVSVDFDMTQIGTTITDTTGKFVLRIAVPKTALPGTHTVRATGQTSGLTAPTLFLVRTDWAQDSFGPYHTGNNPYENVLTPSNVSNMVLDWSYSTGEYNGGTSPSVVNGVVYVGFYFSNDITDYSKVYALDAATGTLKWSHAIVGSVTDSPAVVNGVVYIGTDANNLYALDETTGALKWSYYTGAGYLGSSPTVVNGVVYIDNQNNKLYALDAVTGALKWSYTTANLIFSSPAVANGLVYISTVQDKLYALDATTGTLKWSYPINSSSTPSVVNGIVYIGANDNKLYALDAATGNLKWTYTTEYLIYDTPAVANGVVYFSSQDRTLYALDAATGMLKWRYAVTGLYFFNPVVANGVVYIGSVGIGSQDGTLYALDAKTGMYKWSYTHQGHAIDPPIVANGVIYTCSDDGTLYAFHLPSMS